MQIEDKVYPEEKITKNLKLKKLFVKKFKKRVSEIGKGRNKENIILLKRLVKDMFDSGFSQLKISELLQKDVTTINYHLRGRKR